MIAKALTLSGGILGAATLSQFPEFSQQYAQRLGGAVDELSRVVADFDRDAATLGLTRDSALADLANGGSMGRARASTMTRTIERHAHLSADLSALQGHGPFTRAYLAAHMHDRDIARRTWQTYKPALPATFEGAIFALVGFFAGFVGPRLLFSLLRRPFRRPATTI